MNTTNERKYCIEQHRNMWTTIADKTEKRQTCYTKSDYIKEYLPEMKDIESHCWLCHYAYVLSASDCSDCPLKWRSRKTAANYHACLNSYFGEWRNACYSKDWKSAAKYAKIIANLQES